jgi:hypothetical protein
VTSDFRPSSLMYLCFLWLFCFCVTLLLVSSGVTAANFAQQGGQHYSLGKKSRRKTMTMTLRSKSQDSFTNQQRKYQAVASWDMLFG